MKKKIIIAVVLVLLIGFSIHHFRGRTHQANEEETYVTVSHVTQITLPQKIHAIGTLVARSVDISPEMAGHVQAILFQDGAEVKAGTPLIQLDDAVYRAKYESAKAKYNFSQSNFNRKSLLGKQGVISKQDIDQASADLIEQKAEADENQVMLEKMKLVAPFDGVVGKSKVNPGDYVTTGQNVVTLTDTQHLRIEYTVPDKYVSQLKLGQEVQVTTNAYPGKIFTGAVAFISPTINSDNRSLALYAELPNADHLLKPGMYVEVTQSLNGEEHALMIPSRSLIPILDGLQVYKVVEGKAFAVNVTIGKRDANQVQIVQGLEPSDIVITDGQMKVKNGMPVKTTT